MDSEKKMNNIPEVKLLFKKRSIKDLADYIRIKSGTSPNYAIFLGAGASVTSGIKTGFELVQEWRKEIFDRLSPNPYTDPDSAAEWLAENHPDWYDKNNEYSSLFEKKFDLPSQRRRFVELQVDKKLPSIGYAYLVELFESKFFDTVFTTNFDDLINEAFYQFSSDRPLLCAHDSSIKGISIASSRPKIIKLHGDYLFDSIKSSLKETESLENNTKEKLVEFSKEYGLIFVGYAGNDNSIIEVLKYLLKQPDYLKNGIYWCKRKGDKITPELFKLLNQEKVYWVEIDGFDELMAELVHELGSQLSLGETLKATKREKMIQNFITDNHGLTKNKFISKDLIKLKKYTYTQDISSLINELSESDNDEQKIPEEDFKNLLFIDNLIREKNFSLAEEKLKDFISDSNNHNIKSKYLQRIISLKINNEDIKSALEYSDKLIELDEFNLNNALSRTNILPKLTEKIQYLKDLKLKFNYSINVKNNLCRIALRYLEYNKESIFSFKEIYDLIEESLYQDNSLQNSAWRIKFDAILDEYSDCIDKKERREKLYALLNKIKDINPTHDTYLNIFSSCSILEKEKSKIFDCISHLENVYNSSSKNKKKNILKYLTKLHSCLLTLDDGEKEKTIINEFINKYSEDENISNIAPFKLFIAKYEIGQNKDIAKGIELAKEAIDSPWRNENIHEILSILLIDKNNIQISEEFLDNISKDIPETSYLESKVEILNSKNEFSKSLKILEKMFHKQYNFSRYISSKVYTLLMDENYNEVITIVNENLDKLRDYQEKDILIINRELAKSKIGIDISKHELHSIISHNQSKGDVAMCAFFILGDELNGNRQLKNAIEKDYMNYFNFLKWPAIPKKFLSIYSSQDSKVA